MGALAAWRWGLGSALGPRPPAAPGGWLPAALGAVLLAAAVAGCGRKTAPRPVLLAAAPLVKVWQRDRQAVVAWAMPSGAALLKFDGLAGYVLAWKRFPPLCFACDAVEEVELRLVAGHGIFRTEAGWAYYRMPLPEQPADWHFRVATRYGSGATPFSPVALLLGRVDIPAHTLAWKLAPLARNAAGKGAIFRRVQLHWPLRRERIVHTVSKQGSPVEHEEFFRANLYRRIAGRPWPFWPMNQEPVEGPQRIVSLPTGTRGNPAPRIEFFLRLVDQFGNEGPATPPVSPDVTPERP